MADTVSTGAKIILTPEQIIAKLNTDKKFGLQFIVENQPNIVIDKLKSMQISGIDTPAKAHAYLTSLIEVEPQKVREILNGIPYNAANPNWTGTLDEYFPTSMTKSGGLWSGILSGVGSVLTAIGSATGSTTGVNLTPVELAALQEEERKRAEEERKATQRKYLVWAIALIILFIAGAMIYKAQTNKNKS